MNPMQGQQNTGGSSTELNHGDNESVYSVEITMMNPLDNGFPVTSNTPPERTYYASPGSHAAQNHNWWRLGEPSSSVSRPSGQVEIKTNQDGRQSRSNGMMVHTAGYIRNGPTFLRGSSSNAMPPQHANMSMDMDMDMDDCGAQQSSGLVFRRGSSLGSSVQVTGESSSGPAASSSLDGWGSSCKRKALEASAAAPSPTYGGASSSLSLATPPSQTSPDRTEQMFGSGGRTNTVMRNADTSSSRLGRRLNPRQTVGFSLSHSGGGSMQPSSPLNSAFLDPQDMTSSSGENQTNLVHLPALTRNIPQFDWDTSYGSRASTSSSGPQWKSNPEQPMLAPPDQSIWRFTRGSPADDSQAGPPSSAIQAHQQQQQLSTAWILPPTPLHNNNNNNNNPPPRGTSELSPWSLFPPPSVESQSTTSHVGASLTLLPTGPPSVSSNEAPAIPSSSNTRSHRSRQRRSGLLLSERHNELLHLRHLGRSLAADSDGRNHLISEIRQVLTTMRRWENLRIEDYMVFDPLIFQSMTEMHDRHREMRLDVDNMSYEELLALGERIGDVGTGLREDVILKTMKQHKCTSSSAELHQEPCCICQEEYAEGDDLGTLECGHEFHKDCIKLWVMLKNLCPICKTVALTT